MTISLVKARKRTMVRVLIVLLFIPNFLFAALVIEPQIAYKSGKLDEGPGAKSSVNGASFGGKLGWGFGSGFSWGLDGNYSNLEKEYTLAPRILYSAVAKQVGVYVAADFRAFQASTSYFIVDEIKYSNRDEELKGNAVKLGLSIPVIASLNANFDYVKHNYREAIGSVATIPNDANTVMISLSYLLHANL
jgi:hypothetical protein